MLDLTLRQIRILDHLLQSEISYIDDLLSYVAISSRTLQSEVSCINQELERAGCSITIKPNRGRGYCAEPNNENREIYECLKLQCQSYLNHELTLRYGDNPRIAALIRMFLCADTYIKAEDLQDEFHVSTATLTNDLRLVRSIFEAYGIQMSSTPYHGMKLNGSAYAIRCAMIDFCDIYDVYTDSYYFTPQALDAYHIDPAMILELRKNLTDILQQHHIHLQEQGFERLYFYLLIQKGIGEVLPPLPHEAMILHEYEACATELMDYVQFQEQPIFLQLLLFIYSDDSNGSELSQTWKNQQIESLLGDLVLFMHKEIHLDLGRKLHIIDRLKQYLKSFLWKQQFGIHFYNHHMSIREIIKDIPVSTSLSYQLLEYLHHLHGYVYDSDDFISLIIPLFNAIFLVPNEYQMVRIAFLGPFDASTVSSVGYRMSMAERHNIHRDYYALHEIDTIDFTKYECVFVVNGKGIELKQCPCEVFYIDYFYRFNNDRDFFNQVLAKHRIENFLLYKIDEQSVFTIEAEHPLQQVISILSEYGYDAKHKEQIIQHLLADNAQLYMQDPFVICLLWHKELEYTLFKFEFVHPLKIHDHELHELQIVIMDPNDNVLAVKQADSYIRRMQHSCVL